MPGYDKIGCKSLVKSSMRLCLKCLKPFPSAGVFNRLCVKCNAQNQLINPAKTENVHVGGYNGGRVMRKPIER